MNPNMDKYVQTPLIETPLANRILASPQSFAEFQAVPAGEVETYGATPLDRMTTLSQQSEAKRNFLKLTYSIPDNIPIEIASEVHDSFGRRFDARGEANDENFVTSLMYERQDELDPVIRDMVDKAKTGHASPAELLLVREAMGIRSVELACLTHPYGTNIEILDDMRTAVELAILSVGGKVFDEPEVRYAVKESIGETPTEYDTHLGLLMTRKRIIGVLPDGTHIRERSSFILRTDDKIDLPEEVKQVLAAISAEDTDWREKAGSSEALLAYLAELLENNHTTYAIPISSTAYAFNETTAKQVSQHVLDGEAERQRAWAALTDGMSGYGMLDMNNADALAYHEQSEAEIRAHRKYAERQFQQSIPIIINGTLKHLDDL